MAISPEIFLCRIRILLTWCGPRPSSRRRRAGWGRGVQVEWLVVSEDQSCAVDLATWELEGSGDQHLDAYAPVDRQSYRECQGQEPFLPCIQHSSSRFHLEGVLGSSRRRKPPSNGMSPAWVVACTVPSECLPALHSIFVTWAYKMAVRKRADFVSFWYEFRSWQV